MKKLLKVILSIMLICFLVYRVDWGHIRTQLTSADLVIISIVLVIKMLQFPISTYKWRKCLEVHEVHYPFLFLQKILCIGFFFNNFLPTAIGGDGYRVFKTLPKNGSRSRAVSAVLLERIIGIAALLFIGLIYATLKFSEYQIPLVRVFVMIGMGAIAFSLLCVFLYSTGVIKPFVKQKISGTKFEFLIENFRYINKNKKGLLNIVATSFIFHSLAITGIYLLFITFGINSSFASCALIAALSGVASVIPISINGIGVVEGTFVYVSTQIGIDYDQAVLVAFMIRILSLPFSLMCGIVYLVSSKD